MASSALPTDERRGVALASFPSEPPRDPAPYLLLRAQHIRKTRRESRADYTMRKIDFLEESSEAVEELARDTNARKRFRPRLVPARLATRAPLVEWRPCGMKSTRATLREEGGSSLSRAQGIPLLHMATVSSYLAALTAEDASNTTLSGWTARQKRAAHRNCQGRGRTSRCAARWTRLSGA